MQRTLRNARAICTVVIYAWCFLSFAHFSRPAYAGAADEYPTGSLIDRSTPDSALGFFIKATNEIRDYMEFFKKKREETNSWWYPQPTEEERKRIDYLMPEIIDSMDLSAIPEWSRETIGAERAFMIREILRLSKANASTELRKLKDDLWVVPGTYLQIGKIPSGMRMGDVTFTAETVANLPYLYRKVIGKKPKHEFNTYKFYTESPGGIIPPAWAGVVFALPGFWLQSYGSNTIWQWSIFGLALILLFLGPWFLRKLFPQGHWRLMGFAASTMLLAKLGNYMVIEQGGLTSDGAVIASIIFSIIFYLSLSLAAFMMSEIVADNCTDISHLNPRNVDSSVIRLICRVVGVAAGLGIIIYGLNTAGFPVLGIVAGLGVGGLAFALAAKPTLENLLAGVVIYMDKSVYVGDHIESKDIEGVVEEIGMRSTRLRSSDGTLISITNSELSDKIIRNKTRRITSAKGLAENAEQDGLQTES
jgi:MscS family membrane protein